MNSKAHYFRLLGIQPTTDLSAIKKAYRKKVMMVHPDRNPSVDAQTKFIELTEAYEILTGIRNETLHEDPVKTAEEIRAEKIRAAQERYRKFQATEKQKDEVYYRDITSGKKWKYFKILAYSAMVLSCLFTIDYFFTRQSVSVDTIGRYYMISNHSFSTQIGMCSYEGETFQVGTRKLQTYKIEDNSFKDEPFENEFDNSEPIESRLTSLYPIQVNYSLIFRDVKSLNISKNPLLDNLAGHPKYSNSRFKLFENYDFEEIYSMNSIYSSFPLVQLVLLIPFLVYKFKRPNVTFVIGRLVSYWLVLPLMIVLLFISSSPRILSAFGIL
jgi:hypothetical protein